MIYLVFRICRFIVSKRFYSLITFTCLRVSCANAQYQQLLHKTYAQRVAPLAVFYLDDIRTKDSLQVFSQIAQIRKLAIDNHDDDLLLETKLMRANYFYYRTTKFAPKINLGNN